MPILSSVITYLGPALGALGAIAGLALQGMDGGILGGFVGYFLGKTMQSILWTLLGDYAT